MRLKSPSSRRVLLQSLIIELTRPDTPSSLLYQLPEQQIVPWRWYGVLLPAGPLTGFWVCRPPVLLNYTKRHSTPCCHYANRALAILDTPFLSFAIAFNVRLGSS
jgi:hypothetical protein